MRFDNKSMADVFWVVEDVVFGVENQNRSTFLLCACLCVGGLAMDRWQSETHRLEDDGNHARTREMIRTERCQIPAGFHPAPSFLSIQLARII